MPWAVRSKAGLGLRGEAEQKRLAAPSVTNKPISPRRILRATPEPRTRRLRPATFERGAATARCKPKGAQPAMDSPPRAACELNATGKQEDSDMRAEVCICPTFDISGRRRAQPFDCPLDGRVSRHDLATKCAERHGSIVSVAAERSNTMLNPIGMSTCSEPKSDMGTSKSNAKLKN